MKIAPGKSLPPAIIRGLRGAGYHTMHRLGQQYVLKNPRSPSKPPTPLQQDNRDGMKLLAQAHRECMGVERTYAQLIAEGTQLVWRDVLSLAYTGQLVEIPGVLPGMAYPDLDMIATLPGSLLVREPGGWVGLGPSSEGQVVTMANGLPRWRTPPGGGGIGSITQLHWESSNVLIFNNTLSVLRAQETFTPQANDSWVVRCLLQTGSAFGDVGLAIYSPTLDCGFFYAIENTGTNHKVKSFDGSSYHDLFSATEPNGIAGGPRELDLQISVATGVAAHGLLATGLPPGSYAMPSGKVLAGVQWRIAIRNGSAPGTNLRASFQQLL